MEWWQWLLFASTLLAVGLSKRVWREHVRQHWPKSTYVQRTVMVASLILGSYIRFLGLSTVAIIVLFAVVSLINWFIG